MFYGHRNYKRFSFRSYTTKTNGNSKPLLTQIKYKEFENNACVFVPCLNSNYFNLSTNHFNVKVVGHISWISVSFYEVSRRLETSDGLFCPHSLKSLECG